MYQTAVFTRQRPASSPSSTAAMLVLASLASLAAAEGPCDILGAAGNPCVAAHSTTRALCEFYILPTQVPDSSGCWFQDAGFSDVCAHVL